MSLARRGQNCLHGGLSLVTSFAVEFHRKHVLQTAVRVTTDVEGAGAAEHRQSTTVANEIPDLIQIHGVEVGAMRKVVEDEDVEVLELFQKNVVDGKWNQAQLVFRHVDIIRWGAQKDKGHQFYQRVLFHRHAEKTIVPGRRAGQCEHANLIALHVDLKFLLVVLCKLLSRLNVNT